MVTEKYENMEPKPDNEADRPAEIMTTREFSAKVGLTLVMLVMFRNVSGNSNSVILVDQLVMFPPGRNSFHRPVSKDSDDTDEQDGPHKVSSRHLGN